MELSPKVQRALTIGLTLGAGGLALSGCGSNEKEAITTADIEYPPVSAPAQSNNSPIKNVRYFEDGSRTYKIAGWSWRKDAEISVKEVCVSGDLVTLSKGGGTAGVGQTRLPDKIECTDGRLTRDEFPGE